MAIKASSSSSMGFANVAGKSSYDFIGKAVGSFTEQSGLNAKSKQWQDVKKEKYEGTGHTPPKYFDFKKSPAVAEENTKVAASTPAKPKKTSTRRSKDSDATTKDVETAVSKGYITPEEATGGEWGKSAALSSTYSKKSAANAAAHGGTNVGKQFTGVRASKNSVGARPTFDVAPNFSSAPADSRPKTGDIVNTPHGKAVKLD